jgi:cytochrome c oxidase cbb3-type subunit 3
MKSSHKGAGVNSSAGKPARRRWIIQGGVALALLAIPLSWWLQQRAEAALLMRTEPDQLLKNTALAQYASDLARPLYAKHCAVCHGATMHGAKRGVPDLADGYWLYNNDLVDIEHTILYGVRSGHPKSRNVTEMPALVRTGLITADDAKDVTEYVLSISGQPHDSAAAERGRAIYFNKGNCFDCHASDARGVTDYGTPPLIGPIWLYGGDRQTLYQSIDSGRHGECPAWINKLKPAEVRALAVYLKTATVLAATVARK